jgi:hypothetical protein
MRIKSTFLFFITWFATYNVFGQTDSAFFSRAAKVLESQPANEKVYLHLNKPNYDFGDTIWYKAYTVVGQHHQLSALSGVLYVELISPKDSLVIRQILPLTSGVAWSEIPLSKTLPQGSYRLRAYTTWMRNAGPNYFYAQKVRIGGIPATAAKASEKPDVQFFPEGGELVNDVRSRVAVKSVAANGFGEDIKGTIEDNDGNVVADFATQHLGMGVFALTPQSGKTYKAKISAGETGFNVDLPKAGDEGYTLALNNNGPDSIFIKVAVNEKTFTGQKNNAFYIIGQNSGKVYYTSQAKLEGLVYTASVDKSRFPGGIIQFTLFSQNGKPVAERIAFIRGKDILNLNINAPANTYTMRQQVKINLDVKDDNGNPATGSFSVSVINETLVNPDENEESTILNNLLLTAELKGFIEQPNYYFSHVNEQTNADLDVLMLTQGYRRFDWKEILSSASKPVIYPPETSLAISGTLKTPSGKPIPHGSVTLLATKENLLRDTTTNAGGNFKFTDINLTDTANIVLKARKANKNDNVLITLQPPGYPVITPGTFPETEITPLKPQAAAVMQQRFIDYVKEQQPNKKSIQLKQVNIHGNRPPKKPELTFSSNLNGPGHADQIIMGKDVQGCVTLSDCLEGRVTGVVFTHPNKWGERKPYLMRAMGRLAAAPYMVVIVDGIIMEGDHLDEINTKDIASIEVLRSGSYLAIYGSNAPGGALVITTKRGGEDSRAVTPKPSLGLLAYNFAGYYKAKTFYAPKYKAKGNTQLTDLRNAIYWNPNILSDKDGKASFDFFNNDTKGTYRVVVEGIDDDGNLGRAVYRYKVE